MQYEAISAACDNLLSLLNGAKCAVPDHVEGVIASTIDTVLTTLETLEETWDIRSPE